MVEETIEQIRIRLQCSLNDGQEEWNVIRKLLPASESERLPVLAWLFEKYVGYVEPRARAGQQVMANAPTQAWAILERLVPSADPDDRDTAFEVLAVIDNDRAKQMARPLLSDEYPYIRLEAAHFLHTKYPEDVRASLKELLGHRVAQVRVEAEQIVRQMEGY